MEIYFLIFKFKNTILSKISIASYLASVLLTAQRTKN